jgi:disulfide bond formation protein DsbB
VRFLKEQALLIAWLMTLIAFLITLYLSEVLRWPVCHLCWYQRICLYPQIVLLGIGVYKNDRSILPYTMTLSIIGFIFAFYQYLTQLFPIAFEGIALCGTGPSCATIHINWLGFITLPLISMAGFLIVLIIESIGRECKQAV